MPVMESDCTMSTDKSTTHDRRIILIRYKIVSTTNTVYQINIFHSFHKCIFFIIKTKVNLLQAQRGPGWLNELGREGPGGSMSQVVVRPGWLNELGSCRARVAQRVRQLQGPGGSMSQVVVRPGWFNELGSCRTRVAQ